MPPDPAAAHRIVSAGFEAVAEPQRWNDVAAAIAGAMPHEMQVALRIVDRAAGIERYVAGHGFSEAAIRSYLAYFSRVNPWTQPLVATPVGRPALSAELVPDAEIDRSEFCNDFLRPERIGTAGLGINLAASGGTTLTVTVQWRRADGPALERPMVELLSRAGPGLARATDIAGRVWRQGTAEGLAAGIEAIAAPVVVLSRAGRVVAANAAGQTLLGGHILRLDRGGRLRAAGDVAQRRLDAAVALAVGPAPRNAWVRLAAGLPSAELVLSLVRYAAAGPHAFALPDPASEPAALLYAAVETPDADRLVSLLGAAHAVAPRDAAVAIAVAAGKTLREAADATGLTLETAEAALARVMDRLNAKRRSDLTRKIVSLAVVPRPGPPR